MSETPGYKAIENFKSINNSLAEFKVPSNFGKKSKQKILTEEKYIEEMSKIIQRDFFPDLEKLRAQNEYLEAVENKDLAKIQQIRAKYSGREFTDRRKSMTPATFETPQSMGAGKTPRNASTGNTTNPECKKSDETPSVCDNKKKSISKSHSLDSFLQAYTSEDNYSFQDIIDTADEKLRQKFAVLYNEEKVSAEKMAIALSLPSIEKQFDKVDPLRKIETWSYKNKNYIMFIPDGVDLTEREKVENAVRKQEISHNNTRLSYNPFTESKSKEILSQNSKTQSKLLAGKVGIDGNIVSETNMPQIRGFDLVKTPSPRPGEAFSPLMTWGEIEGTPFRLDGSDTPIRTNNGPSFHINESSRRETIGLALAEKVGEKMRAQKQRAMNTARKNIGSPFIRSSLDRLASMSPAARRLATSKLGIRTPILTPISLGHRTPQIGSNKTLSSGLSTSAQRKAPTPNTTSKQITSSKCDLTDNLLKIPTKRLKASDFF